MFTEANRSERTMGEKPTTRRFLFDQSFDAAAVRVPERKPVTLKPEQVDALKQESFDDGFAAGHKVGAEEQLSQLMTTLEALGGRVEGLMQARDAMYRALEVETRAAILAIACRMLPAFVAQHGTGEIEALFAQALASMVKEPRLVVRVHEQQCELLNERFLALAAVQAYAGRVVVMADETIKLGDCRIEWAEGGIERRIEGTWNAIEQIVMPETVQETYPNQDQPL